MCCRYNPGGVFTMSNGIMDNPGDAKYGFTKDQLFEGYRQLKELGVKHFGIHAFIASNTVSNDYYPILAGQLFELAAEISRKLDIHFSFINLSGGVGVPYTPDGVPNDIYAIGEGVRRKYEEILVPAGMDDVAIYTEMGRFMLAPYGALVTRAIHEKHIYKEYIGVDACAANLMRPAMYGAYHHITVLGKEDAPCDHKYDVVGSLCENNDKFAIDRMLPEIEKGDLLYIHDTGAHGFAMGYSYNGRIPADGVKVTDPGDIEKLLYVHEHSIQPPEVREPVMVNVKTWYGEEVNAWLDREFNFTLCYQLKNGRLVYRYYTAYADTDIGEILGPWFSTVPVVTGMQEDELQEVVDSAYWTYLEGVELQLTKAQMQDLMDAIIADCHAGNMIQRTAFHDEACYSRNFSVEFSYSGEDRANRWMHVTVYPCCENVYQWMDENDMWPILEEAPYK
jgi:hypothetical protein